MSHYQRGRERQRFCACLCAAGWGGGGGVPLELIKEQVIGSDLQVAAARQDQEDLRVVDRQQHTARREDDHDDMEQVKPPGLRDEARAG